MNRALQCNEKPKLMKIQTVPNTVRKTLDTSGNDSLTDIFKNYKVTEKPRLNGGDIRENRTAVENKKSNSSTVCRKKPRSILSANNTCSKTSILSENDISFEVFGDVEIPTEKTKDLNNFGLWSDDDMHIPEKPVIKKEDIKNAEGVFESYRTEKQIAIPNQPTDIVDLLRDNAIQFCPICLKKNTVSDTALFVPHLKSCASKNEVSTEQLLKAIELQQKQNTERAALGLPAVAQDRQVPRRPAVRKAKTDSNLELAIALSASLKESEMLAKVREAETLLEAGLEKEAFSQCKQLEDFGFVASKAVEPAPLKSSGRSKVSRNTVLFTRTQEERERIITEKITIILVDSVGQTDAVPELTYSARDLKSSFLRNHRDVDATLWNKSYQSEKHTDYDCYYIGNLSAYVSPCKFSVGAKLKHLSQIPCRLSSPGKTSIKDSCLNELTEIFASKTVKFSPLDKTEMIPTVTPVTKSKVAPVRNRPSYSQLSQDWRSLLNKKAMSDLTIYGKDETPIFAHKLVLYARCRVILSETIKETTNGEQCSEMIVWLEYSYEAIVAFLEHIYTGELPDITKLTKSQLADLKSLCSRYKFSEVLNHIDRHNAGDGMFDEDIGADRICDGYYAINAAKPVAYNQGNAVPIGSFETVGDAETAANHPPQLTEGEQNLLRLQIELQTQKSPPSAIGSPEMFNSWETTAVDAVVTETINSEEQDDQKNVLTASPFSEPGFGRSSKSSASKSIDEILSRLCSPNRSPTRASPSPRNLSSQISNIDDIKSSPSNNTRVCISYSFSQPNPECISFEKRKSCSPLDRSPVKKTKVQSQSARNLRTTFGGDLSTPVKRQKRVSQKSPLNELLEMSDSGSNSDSEIALFDLDMSPGTNVDSNDSEARLPKCNSRTDCDSSADDYRNSLPDDGIDRLSTIELSDESVTNSAAEDENLTESCQRSTVVQAEYVDSPYVSPVWDGFEEANYDFYHEHHSHEVHSEMPGPSSVSNLSSTGFRITPEARSTARLKAGSIEPFFDSFSIDESALHRLENASKTQSPNTIRTPESVRKFKCRSKSDNVLTPSRNVTPMADYSAMKSVELKKELDKYGLKPGLSRGKAKKLLRYIYDQLHPIEDRNSDLQGPEPTRRKGNSSRADSSRGENQLNKVDDRESDSDSSLLSSGVGVLEESFNEDDGLSQESNGTSQSRLVNLDIGFRNLIRQDEALHRKILLYEPVWLEPLKGSLKENGVKCNLRELMNYLDEKCITFRSQQQRGRRKRKKNEER